MHLGKHGTLEWLPGKTLALSAECAPDAALGDIPLVYPFVVNDPGEGVQAKRRVHAVIVDHLVPPMMRADTYDEMAELEALLDEYARLDVLDPSKLPALAVQIWDAIERANLQSDLDIEERPDDVATLVEHIDGYLCEVKDIQIKDGLHVLGQPPRGDQMRGLVSAILRLGSGDVAGLRSAVGAAFGLDEPALVAAAGSPAPAARARAAGALPRAVGERRRSRRPARGGADGAARRARRARLGRGRASAPSALDVLGRGDAASSARSRFAAREVVPRILRTTDELDNVIARAQRPPRAVGPVGQPDARARRRAADRAATSTPSTRARCRPSSRGRSAAGSPTRCSTASAARRASCRAWSAWWRGGRRRCARRATTSPRSSR